MAGVSAAAVTKACSAGLAPATEGKRIDANHAAAVAYLDRRAPGKPAPKKRDGRKKAVPHARGHVVRNEKRKRAPVWEPTGDGEIPDNIQDFVDMTLREIIGRFGTETRFGDWLKATKQIEDIAAARIKNAASAGELVSRHLVKIGIIDPINSAHVRLLRDGSKTIAQRSTAMVKAGATPVEIEAFVEDQIASFIRPVKAKVRRALDD